MAKKASSKKAGKPITSSAKKAAGLAAQKVTPEMVKQDVINCIVAEARANEADVQKPDKFVRLVNGDTTLDLEADLNIDGERRAALHQEYQKISHGKFGGAKISRGEARQATTVAKAIALVAKAATGAGPGIK